MWEVSKEAKGVEKSNPRLRALNKTWMCMKYPGDCAAEHLGRFCYPEIQTET